MVVVSCIHCESVLLMKDGKTAAGKQRCRGCGRRSCENPYRGRPPEVESQVLALLQERTSQRGVSRALKISRVTVAEILKKRRAVDRATATKRSGVSGAHAVARTGGTGVGRGVIVRRHQEESRVDLECSLSVYPSSGGLVVWPA